MRRGRDRRAGATKHVLFGDFSMEGQIMGSWDERWDMCKGSLGVQLQDSATCFWHLHSHTVRCCQWQLVADAAQPLLVAINAIGHNNFGITRKTGEERSMLKHAHAGAFIGAALAIQKMFLKVKTRIRRGIHWRCLGVNNSFTSDAWEGSGYKLKSYL